MRRRGGVVEIWVAGSIRAKDTFDDVMNSGLIRACEAYSVGHSARSLGANRRKVDSAKGADRTCLLAIGFL